MMLRILKPIALAALAMLLLAGCGEERPVETTACSGSAMRTLPRPTASPTPPITSEASIGATFGKNSTANK